MNSDRKEAKGFFIFFNDVNLLARLSDSEVGWLFNALIEYALKGVTPIYPNGDRYLKFVFETFSKRINSYYAKQGLSRPETKDEVEPLDDELVFKPDEAFCRIAVNPSEFTLDVQK